MLPDFGGNILTRLSTLLFKLVEGIVKELYSFPRFFKNFLSYSQNKTIWFFTEKHRQGYWKCVLAVQTNWSMKYFALKEMCHIIKSRSWQINFGIWRCFSSKDAKSCFYATKWLFCGFFSKYSGSILFPELKQRSSQLRQKKMIELSRLFPKCPEQHLGNSNFSHF